MEIFQIIMDIKIRVIQGRLAEVPPTAYPNQIAVARVRLGGGICMKQGPDDRNAVA